MAREDKAAAVAQLTEQFESAGAVVLTEYRGLSVAQLKTLRRALGEDATYAVAKNTLMKLAANKAGIDMLDEILTGPNALTFIKGDIAAVAKGLKNFAKDNPLLVIKGGVMEGKFLDAKQVGALADLESREVYLAKLAGAMKGNLAKAVGLFAAPLQTAARAFGALQTAAEANPSLIAGAGEAPAVLPGSPLQAGQAVTTTEPETADAAPAAAAEAAPAAEAAEAAPAAE
ncbi:50S ribosomal protein L10 [Raineyella sp. W15-4]|uniref:50S ribosomal protein L10 n=1 Tax=Raineyella sp. W15-4 TaxID=3081651 RepID=UPI0029540712|nr:50S ribosomal protein L10 [Raineyella sp. W15-4]WOQ17713.1 50S ribosomal protein L10 [Raineyella sp. W15-4]